MRRLLFWLRRVRGTKVAACTHQTTNQSPFLFNHLSQGRTKVSIRAQNNLFAVSVSRRRHLASPGSLASGRLIASCYLRGPKNVNLWFPYLQLEVKLLRFNDCRIVYHLISTSKLNKQFNDSKILKIRLFFLLLLLKQFNLIPSFTVRIGSSLIGYMRLETYVLLASRM